MRLSSNTSRCRMKYTEFARFFSRPCVYSMWVDAAIFVSWLFRVLSHTNQAFSRSYETRICICMYEFVHSTVDGRENNRLVRSHGDKTRRRPATDVAVLRCTYIHSVNLVKTLGNHLNYRATSVYFATSNRLSFCQHVHTRRLFTCKYQRFQRKSWRNIEHLESFQANSDDKVSTTV